MRSKLILIVILIVYLMFVPKNVETSVAVDLAAPRICEPIRIDLCRGIGYNETSMPNLVGHELQTDADFTLQTFSPLIQYGCSAQLHFFLCSAYVPMCTSKVPVPIGPCRGLCETVRARCHPVLQGFGFPWPAALDCNRFPKENNHEHMCMEGPGEPGGGLPTLSTKITSPLQPSCQGLAKSHLYVRLNRSGRCAPLCEADILFDQREKYLAEIWVSAWSYAALGTAIIATICLIFSDTKWDKILTPLVTCHSLVAIGWTVRFIVGRNSSACGYDLQLPNVSLLLIDGLSNASCAVTFLLRYYFGMSAGVWWSILCLEWHRDVRRTRNDLTEPSSISISAANNNLNNTMNCNKQQQQQQQQRQKSCSKTKNKDTYNNLSQLAAWGLPALQTGAVLVTRLVDADELLGACYVGNHSDKALKILVATPLFSYWIFGSVNIFAGYLVHRRTPAVTLPSSSSSSVGINSSPLHINMSGVGKFLFIYCIPSGLLLISVFYEFANTDIWLSLPQPTYEPVPPIKAPMWPFMMRAFMELMLGVISSAWALGPRISTMYKNRFTLKYKHPPLPPSASLSTTKYPPAGAAYSTASYQTVCQPTVINLDRIQRYPTLSTTRKHPMQSHLSSSTRKPRGSCKISSHRAYSLNGNETIL